MGKNKDKYKSALKVNSGIEQPLSVNPDAAGQIKKQKELKPEHYLEGIKASNKTFLAKAITLIESSLAEHQTKANEIIEHCLPYAGNSIRIGITGVPGAGKSTFIEALGSYLTGKNHRIAVLAIDPSSQKTKGSILGDKTRMEALANNPKVFIRPSPSGGSLGGVARKTKETIILCEAAGFDTIFVETVGVGQSETAVHSMVDIFLLLMIAGAGDELQGIKRGIMEMADLIVINKADGDNIERTKVAKRTLENALHLFPPPESGWQTIVNTCSSINTSGINEVWDTIVEYVNFTKKTGIFEKKRQYQDLQIMKKTVNDLLKLRFLNDPAIKSLYPQLESKIIAGEINPYSAANQLLDILFKKT
ncbi:MAG: methylmalonyl Co-A mutase-associated GTPase MeaB [Bacteroidales bacterium]|nr:methylmalonyl Co-A mutase-associated GTPase MeaB [Bacteroidales bacterium]